MTLKDMIADDAANVFINADEFAESVAYRALGAQSDRTINAQVFRLGNAGSDESGGVVTPFFEVHVANSATVGISSTEINLGGDVIKLAIRPGESNLSRRIMAIVEQDEGMLVLQCQ